MTPERTIQDAVEALIAVYPMVEGATPPRSQQVEMTSSGPRESAKTEEAGLYRTRGVAIEKFEREMRDLLESRKEGLLGWHFLDGPHVDRFQITITNTRHQHRTAGLYFNVAARIGLVVAPEA